MRVMRRGILAAGAAILLAAACQTSPTTVDPSTSSLVMGDAQALGFDPAKLAAITTAVEADVASGKLPGAYLLIGRHGQVAYQRGFGVQTHTAAAWQFANSRVECARNQCVHRHGATIRA